MKNFKKQLNKKMGTELPESLKKENIVEKLQSETSPEIKKITKITLKQTIITIKP